MLNTARGKLRASEPIGTGSWRQVVVGRKKLMFYSLTELRPLTQWVSFNFAVSQEVYCERLAKT